jgi:hypothetical protein
VYGVKQSIEVIMRRPQSKTITTTKTPKINIVDVIPESILRIFIFNI